ncbi:MAG: alpha-1,6-mannosyltransferase [Limisphaerales bacterium]|jgi:alpha-1,6-mannosyltransferase
MARGSATLNSDQATVDQALLPSISHIISILLILAGTVFLVSLDSRDNFYLLLTGFGISSIGWLIALLISWNAKQLKYAIAAGILARTLWLPFEPYLSDDWIRFAWDGIASVSGYNPFLQLPSEIPELSSALYPKLNSAEYYTVYPPVMQWLFEAAARLTGNNVAGMLLFFKVFILACEIGSIFLIQKLLPLGRKGFTVVYALCPLAISEFTGGVHFEAVMVFSILLAAWYFKRDLWVFGALVFGFAIAFKLIPIILLPLFPFLLGWKKGFAAAAIAFCFGLMTFVPFGIVQTWENISQSMDLYYRNFEFNGCLYYIARGITTKYYGYNQIAFIGPIMALLSGLVILIIAFITRPKTIVQFLAVSMLCLAVYQLFATTIHPWYIAPLVALSAFGRFRFVMVWSVMIFLTYAAYHGGGFEENTALVILEYALVLGLLRLEFIRATPIGRKVLGWTAIKRAQIKFKRLSDWLNLSKTEQILDIGTGNGGLELLFQKNGYNISGVDVARKTCFKSVQPVLYDGRTLPFEDNSFNTVFLITVLHHTQVPENVLAEAIRVSSNQIVIMEDVYRTTVQKQLTFQLDGLVNDEWITHPHSNKTEEEWESLFIASSMRINKKRSDKVFGYFEQITWDLRPE